MLLAGPPPQRDTTSAKSSSRACCWDPSTLCRAGQGLVSIHAKRFETYQRGVSAFADWRRSSLGDSRSTSRPLPGVRPFYSAVDVAINLSLGVRPWCSAVNSVNGSPKETATMVVGNQHGTTRKTTGFCRGVFVWTSPKLMARAKHVAQPD